MRSFIWMFFQRIKAKPYYLALSVFLTTAFIVVAFIISNSAQFSLNVAYVGDNPQIESEYINVTTLAEEPSKTSQIMGRYDVLLIEGDELTISSITNQEYVTFMQAYLGGEDISQWVDDTTNPASRIIGFVMIILLLQCIFYLDLFIEDKHSGNLSRMMISQKKLSHYLFGVMLYGYVIILLIALMVVSVAAFVFNQDLGISILAYGLMFTLVILVGLAKALLLISLIKVRDNAAALYSLIVIITSILSGAFTPLNTDNALLSALINVTPQHHLMEITNQLIENKTYIVSISYVIGFSLLLLLASYLIIKRNLLNGKY